AVAPLTDMQTGRLETFVEAHLAAIERLSRGDGDTPTVWNGPDGLAAREVLAHLARSSDAADTLSADDYRRLLDRQLSQVKIRPRGFRPDPRVAILGTIEARSRLADIVILGGLNEGTWPARPAPDPWINRAQRKALGLPLPERRVGLSAHDFEGAVCAPSVLLTRAIKVDGTPTVASRWLNRLTNLVRGVGTRGIAAHERMRERGAVLLAEAADFDRADRVPPAPRPAPILPPGAAPTRLSATAIERLIRDPYEIYLQSVLGLRRLDPPGRALDRMERGTILHEVMERFVRAIDGGWPDDAQSVLLDSVGQALRDRPLAPWEVATLRARIEAIAPGLLATERGWLERGAPAGIEVSGRLALLGGRFTLTAKADRIDRLDDGTLAIVDYKSGTPATRKQIETFALQLPLEAVIAEAGGFDGIAAAPVAEAILQGLDARTSQTPLSREMLDPAGNRERLEGLLAHYLGEGAAWPPRIRAERRKYPSDGDHISRRGEWDDGTPFQPMEVGR
ncbi:MAG: PD-(D/E)XK nuclease family protein, partial [Rubricella sp.]